MAHFAELELKTDPTSFTTEKKYIVKRVVVVGNDSLYYIFLVMMDGLVISVLMSPGRVV